MTPRYFSHIALALAAVSLLACSRAPETDASAFELAAALLDNDPAVVQPAIEQRYPGSTRVDGGLNRTRVAGAKELREVIIFSDVRSGRVSSVILKFRSGLSDADRGRLLAAAGAPNPEVLAATAEVREVTTDRGRKLRVRQADKKGRFTVTVE